MTTELVALRTPPRPRPRQLSVALVCMPFFLAVRPSIQIGLLHAIVEQAGFRATSMHLNVELAARLGTAPYDALCSHRRRMTGEWLFARAAHGERATAAEAYLAEFPDEVAWVREHLGLDADALVRLREQVLPAWIDECADGTDWSAFDVVGFSSTFQQNVASLALARRIKQRSPRTRIVFGGANFEGEMGPELVRAFRDIIDFAVVGEGDVALPLLLDCLARGRSVAEVPGVVWHDDAGVHARPPGPPIADLDRLPVPRYDDYFDRARARALLDDPGYAWSVPFESSRGCWWGKKHHCTFCGLNGATMSFRSKSAHRVVEELDELAGRHGITFFEATDNILDMAYVDELFGRLRAERLDYQFFYEVKANLAPAQLRAAHLGGVRWIQPGIESLSTSVLRLMRKGATMLQNVRLLKWARYHRVRVSWNLLWGFPGETMADYAAELEVLRAITHLEPPGGCGRIWLERFSPYYTEAAQRGLEDVRPEPSYAHVYPPDVDLDKVAYFFDYRSPSTLPDEAHRETGEQVRAWREAWASAPHSLTYRRTRDRLLVDDSRGPGRQGTITLGGPVARLYEHCSDTMRSLAELKQHLAAGGYQAGDDELAAVLEQLCARQLCLGEGGRYLALAIPVHPEH